MDWNPKQLTQEIRDSLMLLLQAAVPVDTWVASHQNYKPPRSSIWREPNAKPNINDVGAIAFIAALLDTPDNDPELSASLAKRWRAISADPMKSAKQSGLGPHWRRDRDLETEDEDIVFGIGKSGNYGDPGLDIHEPMTRLEFYPKCIPAFMAEVARRNLSANSPPPDWKTLVTDLQKEETLPSWPTDAPRPPEFLKQLLKDALYAAAGLKARPWLGPQELVPLEAGEHRRPGNAFAPSDVANAVTALDKVFQQDGII